MIKLSEIESVHLEVSSKCNARCPGCPRNFYGYPYNNGYTEHNMSLEEAQVIFKDIIRQLKLIRFNGNFGDLVANNETPDIVEWMLTQNPELVIEMSTNGSAQPRQFWERLGNAKVTVDFCIDGLEESHQLYRQDTNFFKILDNAKILNDAGGHARIKSIDFGFNSSDIEKLRELAQTKYGINTFWTQPNDRGSFSSYDKNGHLVHEFFEKSKTVFPLIETQENRVLGDDYLKRVKEKPVASCVNCEAKQNKDIYISSLGDVYPCCYLGFEPKTYGHGSWFEYPNSQYRNWLSTNNALRYSMSECIEWFSKVEQSWSKDNYIKGRLMECDDTCGKW